MTRTELFFFAFYLLLTAFSGKWMYMFSIWSKQSAGISLMSGSLQATPWRLLPSQGSHLFKVYKLLVLLKHKFSLLYDVYHSIFVLMFRALLNERVFLDAVLVRQVCHHYSKILHG